MHNRLIIILAVLFVSTLEAQTTQKDRSPLLVGVALHLTGEYANFGQAFLEGIQLAEEEANTAGGVLGQPLKLIIEDTSYNMARVQSIIRKFSSIDKVDAIIISNYTEVMRVGALIEREKIPTLTIWDSSPDIEELGEYVFGLGAWTPSAAEVNASYAIQTLKAKTAIVIANEGEWSLKVAKYFSDYFSSHGGKILKQISILPSDTDFRSQFALVRSLNPDVIYVPISDNIPAFFSQLSDAKIKAKVLTSDVLSEELLKALGPKVEGIIQSQLGEAQGNLKAQLLEAYRRHFKKECTQSLFVGLGYDTLRVLIEAVRRANTNERQAIKGSLYQVANFPGAAGDISITPEGSSKISEKLFVIKDGKFQEF